jgi:hypothetical protein
VVVWTEGTPPPSHVSSKRRGGGHRWERETPLARVSSKGGVGWRGCVDRVGGGVSTKKTPLHLAFRVREEWRECVDRGNPSISQFKRGRGWWWCVNKGKTPSVSRFERGRGGVERVWTEGVDAVTRRREKHLSSLCRFCCSQ